MGPNGSGKSTLSHVLMGRPGYEVTGGSVTLDGVDLLALAPWQRAQAGLFLAMQYPTEVPGRQPRGRARRGRSSPRAATPAIVHERDGRAEAARIGFDERLPRRARSTSTSPVARRSATRPLQLGGAPAQLRHPRRARLRSRRRRPAGLRPPHRGGHPRGRPRRAGHHPLQPAARRAAARRGAHPRQGPHRRPPAAPSWPTSSRRPATPRRRRRRRRRGRAGPHADDPFADPFA